MIETRPWGHFEVLYADEATWLKELVIFPGQSLSLQVHKHRDEFWYTSDEGVRYRHDDFDGALEPGRIVGCPRGTQHRLYNAGQTVVRVIEWAVGLPDEADIIRLEDNYGRA